MAHRVVVADCLHSSTNNEIRTCNFKDRAGAKIHVGMYRYITFITLPRKHARVGLNCLSHFDGVREA